MSKQFIVIITVATLLGLGFLNYAITKNCEETILDSSCAESAFCKIKTIITKEEAEREAKEKGIFTISGSGGVTKCIPFYQF